MGGGYLRSLRAWEKQRLRRLGLEERSENTYIIYTSNQRKSSQNQHLRHPLPKFRQESNNICFLSTSLKILIGIPGMPKLLDRLSNDQLISQFNSNC